MIIKFFFPCRLRIRLLLCLCLCAISPALQAADTVVGPGGNLQAVLNAASNGDVITVQAGTYTVLTGEPYFHIDQSITLQANGVVTLQAPGGAYVGLAVRASNVTVQGVTLNGGVMGVMVGNAGGVAGAAVSQVTLTALTVNPTGSGGHGIYLYNTSFSAIDSCIVSWAYANGIFLDQNSNNNLLMNNLVQNTGTQHAMAVKNSNFNTLVNNTVTGSAFHGIELIGAAYNRVEKNTVSGFQWDGIVVTPGDAPVTGESTVRLSLCNYLAKNLVVSTGWAAGRVSGTGIWLNDVSDGSYVFGNDVSGSVEAGITAFNSSKSYIQANRVHGNGQAGLLWWNADYPTYPRPSYTVIHNNYIYDNPNNANILIRGAWYNNIAYNYLSGSGLSTPKNDGGISILSWQQSGGSTGNQIYSNTFKDIQVPNYIGPDTTAAQFFQNRYINFGYNYSLQPADAKWDASVYLGGNYWSGFSANGNPSPTTPYSDFIIDAAGNRSSTTGPYVDRFPFQSETLGKPAQITILSPITGQIAAAGSQKTIAWKSKGGALVDIYYHSTGTGLQLIVNNYPDFGFYHWTLPSNLSPGSGYTIRMDCKNSSGQIIGSGAVSGVFTVGSSDLLLLSPGPDLMTNAGSIIRVGWKKSASVTGVNVFIASDAGPWVQLAANVVENFVDLTLPIANSNKVQMMIQSSTDINRQDALDGYFTIRSGAPLFTSPNSATGSVLIGNVLDLEWISPQNAYLVDLDLWDSDIQQFRSIVANLPDRGKYTWFAPEYWMPGIYIRATFRDAAGNALTTINSDSFNLWYTSATGSLIPFYRLYSDITKEHLYTTDVNEYNVLGTLNWAQEGLVGQILNGPRNLGGIEAVPYYRLYDDRIRNHLWTTDRNEYMTLREYPGYHAEHIVGYVYKTQVTGTIPFYRLVFKFPPFYHLWTTDAYEVGVLTAGAWDLEFVAAYLFYQNSPPLTIAAELVPAPPIISVSLTGNGPAAPVNRGDSNKQSVSAYPYQLIFKFPPFYSLWTADINEVALLTDNGWDLEGGGTATEGATLPATSAGPDNSLNGNPPDLEAVVNGASMLSNGISPGLTISLLGKGLGPVSSLVQGFNSGLPVPTELGEVRVYCNGIPAPILYVSAGEIIAIVPYEVAGQSEIQVQTEYQGHLSNIVSMNGVSSAPGVFTTDFSGKGQAVVLNEDHSVNSAANPATPDSLVEIYLTGEGLTHPPIESGTIPALSDPPRPVLPVAVQIAGLPAEVLHARAAPGLPGALQVQVRIPSGIIPGSAIPITLAIGSNITQSGVTLAVK